MMIENPAPPAKLSQLEASHITVRLESRELMICNANASSSRPTALTPVSMSRENYDQVPQHWQWGWALSVYDLPG